VRSRAEAVVSELGDSATHIVSATWTVPLPWFALVDPAERILVLPNEDAVTAHDTPASAARRCYWRVSMADALRRADAAGDLLAETLGEDGPAEVLRDTARWLRHFDAGSLVAMLDEFEDRGLAEVAWQTMDTGVTADVTVRFRLDAGVKHLRILSDTVLDATGEPLLESDYHLLRTMWDRWQTTPR